VLDRKYYLCRKSQKMMSSSADEGTNAGDGETVDMHVLPSSTQYANDVDGRTNRGFHGEVETNESLVVHSPHADEVDEFMASTQVTIVYSLRVLFPDVKLLNTGPITLHRLNKNIILSVEKTAKLRFQESCLRRAKKQKRHS